MLIPKLQNEPLVLFHEALIFVKSSELISVFDAPSTFFFFGSQPAIACSKLTIETLEQGVKYVQS